MRISLQIVMCVLQSLRCVNDIKEKVQHPTPLPSLPPPPPVNGILNYMLLVAVSWVQKDAFRLLDSKKYFLHKRFSWLWGERVEKYMTCYFGCQLTPTEQQSLMDFKSSYFEVLKMCILLLQWHLIEGLFWVFLPLLFFRRDGGLSCVRCLYYVDALGRWMGEPFTQLL